MLERTQPSMQISSTSMACFTRVGLSFFFSLTLAWLDIKKPPEHIRKPQLQIMQLQQKHNFKSKKKNKK